LQPLISVIVPVFNGAEFLPRCLDSILAQTYPNIEVILINDGSTDQTKDICIAFAGNNKRIRYFEQENHGLATTRNVGISMANGEYISFVDADDVVSPDYLDYLYTLLQTGECDISACNHWICRGTRQRQRFCSPERVMRLSPKDAYGHILYDQYPDVSAWGKLYARTVFDGLEYPDGCLFEDTYRIAELLMAGRGIIYGGKPQYFYRIQTDSLSRGRFTASKLDYLDAVDHMTEFMRAQSDGLEKGIARRNMHALLSTRRYLVKCHDDETVVRDDLERRIRVGASEVLIDIRAPLRDKIGILSVCLGTRFYDALWTAYERARRI
jgi:glycosyltransferase involved in cell wall biosynthesis